MVSDMTRLRHVNILLCPCFLGVNHDGLPHFRTYMQILFFVKKKKIETFACKGREIIFTINNCHVEMDQYFVLLHLDCF